jgi:hypothetical protein
MMILRGTSILERQNEDKEIICSITLYVITTLTSE